VSGTIVCWGIHDGGGLDGGQILAPPGTFTTVDAGYFHNCALKPDGTIACWGDNFKGNSNPPPGSFTEVTTGNGHSCALQPDGTVVCWGDNWTGEATPPAGTFTHVTAGNYHTCALRADGTIACWGNNDLGQSTPPTGAFTQVSADGHHACAIKPDRTLVCWGKDVAGQSTPPAGTFTQVEAGEDHACGIRTDGTLACWGHNESGQSTPPAGTFLQVTAGGYHTCAVRTDGAVLCWGNNDYGQSTVPAGLNLTAVSATSGIASNFNGTAVQAGSTVWFNGVLKVGGIGSNGAAVRVSEGTISFSANGTPYTLTLPNAVITYSPSVAVATTHFNAATATWETSVPLGYTGNVFLGGLAYRVPTGGLPGGINPVSWSGKFASDSPGLTVSWKWAAAVYTQFAPTLDNAGVKPLDGDKLSQYGNSDHAGTPELYKQYVTGGARGGGGSNWTGSYSGTAQFKLAQ